MSPLHPLASPPLSSDRTTPRFRAWAAAVALALAVLAALPMPSALAQTDETDQTATDGSDTQAPADGENSPAEPAAFDGEIAVTVDKFGVGNVARAGDWTGFLVKIRDSGTKQRDVLLRITNTDADGDLPTPQRLVATNPGRDQTFWLYTRLTYEDFRRRPVEVTVYEAIDNKAPGAVPEATHRPGRLLGRTEYEPRLGDSGQLRSPAEGLIGLISTANRPLGLSDYSARTMGDQFSSRGQEVTSIVHMTLDDIPDRWMGLASMEALVWASGDISQLRPERARTIREWVERGGHLIIILPTVGQAWTTPNANELFSLLPAVIVDREETADYRAYRPMITADIRSPGYPDTGVLHTFRVSPQATAAEATPILCGKDGACVVARRLVGTGAVTLIGLDLNNEKVQKFVDADIFWHRVLGRRGNYSPVPRQPGSSYINPFKPWYVDKDITDAISVKGRSALGALLGFALFALYWLVVGPPGYFLIKKRDLHKHAWVGFVAGSALFTVVAWGGARALRPFKTDATHLTILDHVYGQPTQRARVWANVLVPRYGEARISVGDATGTADPSLCGIAPWETPEDTSGGAGSFPDSRNYAIDTLSPDAMNVPVRSTVKTIQADWAGPPVLSMPRPVNDTGGMGEIRVTPSSSVDSRIPPVSGSLVHDLPFTLRDVNIIIVKEQNRIVGAPTPNAATFFNAEVLPVGDWAPGQVLDLEVRRSLLKPVETNFVTFLDSLTPKVSGQYGLSDIVDNLTKERRLLALTVFHQLRPPEPPDAAGNQAQAAVPQRRAMHGLDLSRWFTQPCVIVVGFTSGEGKEGRCPVPLYVRDLPGGDAQELPTHGLTMIRWVYPLPARPPEVIDADKQAGRPDNRRSGDTPDPRLDQKPEDKPDLLPGEEGGN